MHAGETKALSSLKSDGLTLAAMQDAAKFSLGRVPAVESTIASLIVSPEEALRPDTRCPHPQCQVMDAAARMGCMGNSLSHLMLALSASLEQTVDASSTSLSYASLQAGSDSPPHLACTVSLVRDL